MNLQVSIIGLLNILLNFNSIIAKISRGHLVTSEKWVFLDRFCFLSNSGTFEYEIEYNKDQGLISLAMYPDIQWSAAYRNESAKTCQQKNDALIIEKRQMVRLDVSKDDSGCEYVHRPRFKKPIDNNGTQNYTTMLHCRNSRSFRSARERWWFISISGCNNTQGLDFSYSFKMTNGMDYWREHFSADEFYILPILTGFCFIYLFVLLTALLFAVDLKCRQLLHVTYKLFLVSLLLQTCGIIFLCSHYGRYATNGHGVPALKLTGRILEGLSEFFFIIVLLLLAKGYTVTRGRLRLASSIKLTIFCCSYFVVYGFLFFFEQYFFDPGLVLYIYESPAGYGILILRLIGWLMFVYAIFFTLKHYPEKSSFYLPFFALYSFWFISGPIIIIISNHVIDKWVREKVSVSVEHCCLFVGHIVFLGLTRPSAANKSFPYHVRTTQVGSNGSDSTQRLDNFDSHSYAPSYIDTSGRIVDIFTVTGVVHGGNSNGIHTPSPMDVFNVNGCAPSTPAVFPGAGAPPKYEDAFPHESPGQIEEMLKESEYSDDDEEENHPNEEEYNKENGEDNNNKSGGGGGGGRSASSSANLRYNHTNNNRGNVYTISN